jgi:Zn-dependent peptidase ImmA (M78 family)
LEDIQKAAQYCRQTWGLGSNAPISNIIRVLENAGILTHSYDMKTNKIDAFSRYGNINIIILNEAKESPSRSIWDATHELGHLVLHTDSHISDKERELQANIFASEFLLPRIGFTREFGNMRKLNWKHLFSLKKRWKVSVAAIIRRAYELRLIDAIQYRRGYKYIHAKGWHLGEPIETETERQNPELLNSAFEDLETATGQDLYNVANSLGFVAKTFEEVTGIEIPDNDMNDNFTPSLTILREHS